MANRRRMEIERDGTRVRFVIHCPDEYDAMALYDEAVAGAEADSLDLTRNRGSNDDESSR